MGDIKRLWCNYEGWWLDDEEKRVCTRMSLRLLCLLKEMMGGSGKKGDNELSCEIKNQRECMI